MAAGSGDRSQEVSDSAGARVAFNFIVGVLRQFRTSGDLRAIGAMFDRIDAAVVERALLGDSDAGGRVRMQAHQLVESLPNAAKPHAGLERWYGGNEGGNDNEFLATAWVLLEAPQSQRGWLPC